MIELKPIDPDEISLPISIAASKLTVSEIGTLVWWMCLNGETQEAMSSRFSEADFMIASQKLKELGILDFDGSKAGLNIKINLDSVL